MSKAVSKLVYGCSLRRHFRVFLAGIQMPYQRRVPLDNLDARHVVPDTECRRRARRKRSGMTLP